ncbi:MAG TPA: hypothetical protein VLH61_12360 [Bacteroidales bacterium]|nr:hypothetical protein [Bacteroidales bacterium]
MIIGFTYDLKDDYLAEGFSELEVAEFDTTETIFSIRDTLENLGHSVILVGNAKALLKRLAAGERWDLVFNICEGVKGFGREAQIPAILDVFELPYVFSDPLVMSLTLHKGFTKRIIRDLGIPTAPFEIVQHVADAESVELPFPLFVKPVAEGTGKGIGHDSKISDKAELIKVCRRLLSNFSQPVLVETFLPGREITVGIVGTGDSSRVIGMMEVLWKNSGISGIYSYHSKANYQGLIEYQVPESELYQRCAEVALASWKGLGCRDGGRIDLRLDAAGVPNFLEVNPLAGLNPVHSDLPILAGKAGIEFKELIDMILQSAMERVGAHK